MIVPVPPPLADGPQPAPRSSPGSPRPDSPSGDAGAASGADSASRGGDSNFESCLNGAMARGKARRKTPRGGGDAPADQAARATSQPVQANTADKDGAFTCLLSVAGFSVPAGAASWNAGQAQPAPATIGNASPPNGHVVDTPGPLVPKAPPKDQTQGQPLPMTAQQNAAAETDTRTVPAMPGAAASTNVGQVPRVNGGPAVPETAPTSSAGAASIAPGMASGAVAPEAANQQLAADLSGSSGEAGRAGYQQQSLRSLVAVALPRSQNGPALPLDAATADKAGETATIALPDKDRHPEAKADTRAVPETTPATAASYTKAEASASDASPATPPAEQVGNAILSHGEKGLQPGPTKLRLQLDPPGLGVVRVHLSASDQSVSARLVVQSETTRQLLQSQADLLRDRLATGGVTLGSFTVTCDSGGSGGQPQQAWRQTTFDPTPLTPTVRSATPAAGGRGGRSSSGVIDVVA